MNVDSSNLFHFDFPVVTYCCDCHYRALPRFYFEISQEMAALHSAFRGVSIPDLNKEGKTWVIIRTIMDINDYLPWGKTVHAVTGTPDSHGFFAPRLVYAISDDDNVVFRAKSTWVVVDIKEHKPCRVGDISERIVPTGISDGLFKGLSASEPKISTELMKAYPVFSVYEPRINYNDIDINSHINNIVYFDWFMNSLPDDFNAAYTPSHIDFCWQHEVRSGNELQVVVYRESENKLGFILNNLSSGNEACVSEMIFTSKKLSAENRIQQ